MKKNRKIIEIDEDKCTGCGQCILSCAEGALELVDGKAKLVGEVLCDGIGACIGQCPEGALRIVEREAEEFDEQTVTERLGGEDRDKRGEDKKEHAKSGAGFQCPHTAAMTINRKESREASDASEPVPSQLGHWPIKLALLGPGVPFLDGADLLLLADCAATAFPDLHHLKGKFSYTPGFSVDAMLQLSVQVAIFGLSAGIGVMHSQEPELKADRSFIQMAKGLELLGTMQQELFQVGVSTNLLPLYIPLELGFSYKRNISGYNAIVFDNFFQFTVKTYFPVWRDWNTDS